MSYLAKKKHRSREETTPGATATLKVAGPHANSQIEFTGVNQLYPDHSGFEFVQTHGATTVGMFYFGHQLSAHLLLLTFYYDHQSSTHLFLPFGSTEHNASTSFARRDDLPSILVLRKKSQPSRDQAPEAGGACMPGPAGGARILKPVSGACKPGGANKQELYLS